MDSSPDRKNIVWISMESVRADHTTVGGYERDTTPYLSQIASLPEGNWFGKCFSSARWTPASTASILSGTHLGTHTVGIHAPTVNTLPESIETIPGILEKLGYETFGIGNNAYITAGTGLDRDFDRFVDPQPKNLYRTVGFGAILNYLLNIGTYGPGLTTNRRLHKMSSMITYATKKWLEERDRTRNPFFIYIHLNDTHYPYTPPKPSLSPFADEIDLSHQEIINHSIDIYDRLFQIVAEGLPLSSEQWDAIEAAYDADIAHVDYFIGELFNYVQTVASRDTIFIVTSDHAELFGECGWLGHHVVPARDVFHVPLVVYGMPEIAHQKDEFVQHIDLSRTIVESVGGDSDQFEGINLRQRTREYAVGQSSPADKDRKKLLEGNQSFDVSKYRFDPVNCIWNNKFKLVVGPEGEELFKFPDEMTNIIDDYPEVATKLRKEVAEQLQGFPETNRREPADFDESTYARLRDMGYIQ